MKLLNVNKLIVGIRSDNKDLKVRLSEQVYKYFTLFKREPIVVTLPLYSRIYEAANILSGVSVMEDTNCFTLNKEVHEINEDNLEFAMVIKDSRHISKWVHLFEEDMNAWILNTICTTVFIVPDLETPADVQAIRNIGGIVIDTVGTDSNAHYAVQNLSKDDSVKTISEDFFELFVKKHLHKLF